MDQTRPDRSLQRPTKGLTYLLKAFKLVLERTAEPVYLVITGQGPEEEKLRREIAG
jgi:glycosyltransferase involved in cell wall biosynthesis